MEDQGCSFNSDFCLFISSDVNFETPFDEKKIKLQNQTKLQKMIIGFPTQKWLKVLFPGFITHNVIFLLPLAFTLAHGSHIPSW